MLQMIGPIHVMYVDIIYKDFQELVASIFKDLCHSSKQNASNILELEWHGIPFI